MRCESFSLQSIIQNVSHYSDLRVNNRFSSGQGYEVGLPKGKTKQISITH
jgi:hypothetical protein